jgi:thioesterase domain-containing protein
VVLPNGPEMAAAFAAIASCAACAPLNPNYTRFEALGGDSLLAVGMLAAVSAAEGVDVPYQRFVERGTIAAIAADLDSPACNHSGVIVPLQSRGKRPPLFCLPGHNGDLLGLARLADSIGPERPVFAFDLNRMMPVASVAELAAQCLSQLRRTEPSGPYRLAGLCFGGVVAFEMARLLREQGEVVELLALIDSLNPAWRLDSVPVRVAASLRQMHFKFANHYRTLLRTPPSEVVGRVAGRAAAFIHNHGEQFAARFRVGNNPAVVNRGLMLNHRPAPCHLNAVLVRVKGRRTDAPNLGWSQTILGRIDLVEVPFNPHGALAGANARRVAVILADRLERL